MNRIEPTAESLDRIFAEIHSESPEDLLDRELNALDRAVGLVGSQFVLFGAGPLGRIILTGLRKLGVQCVAFSDNNPKRWGETIDGLPVLPPEIALRRYGNTAAIVVCIYNGSSVRAELVQKGFSKVIPFALLFWKYPGQFEPQFGIDRPHVVRDNEKPIRDCFAILSDDHSRRELLEQIRWRYWMDFATLSTPLPASDTYFLAPFKSDEVFVDCGALDGDSIQAFLPRSRNNFERIIAVEPDSGSREKLAAYIATLPAAISTKVDVLPFALGDENKVVRFEATLSPSSKISEQHGTNQVECRRIDDISWPAAPTYFKMDIEGAEPEALMGGRNLLASTVPVVAACVYHKCEHLWEIPLLLNSISSEYDIYLRRYAEECWELVCYAVPRARKIA